MEDIKALIDIYRSSNGNHLVLFLLIIGGVILLIFRIWQAMPAMIIGQTGLMFFAGAMICFVGVAANYKSGLDKIWHERFAIVGVLLSQLSILFDFGYWWLNVGSIAAMVALWLLNHKNKTYWVEQVAMLAIILTLISRI